MRKAEYMSFGFFPLNSRVYGSYWLRIHQTIPSQSWELKTDSWKLSRGFPVFFRFPASGFGLKPTLSGWTFSHRLKPVANEEDRLHELPIAIGIWNKSCQPKSWNFTISDPPFPVSGFHPKLRTENWLLKAFSRFSGFLPLSDLMFWAKAHVIGMDL